MIEYNHKIIIKIDWLENSIKTTIKDRDLLGHHTSIDVTDFWKNIYIDISKETLNNETVYLDEQGCDVDVHSILIANKDYALIGKPIKSDVSSYFYFELICFNAFSNGIYTVDTWKIVPENLESIIVPFITEVDILESTPDVQIIPAMRAVLDLVQSQYNK